MVSATAKRRNANCSAPKVSNPININVTQLANPGSNSELPIFLRVNSPTAPDAAMAVKMKIVFAKWTYKVPPYVMGSLAAFWLIQRVLGF